LSASYEIPTYTQNELIHAEVQFRYASGVERVVAFFRHQLNPYVHLALCGVMPVPDHQGSYAGDHLTQIGDDGDNASR
jgi:hypothetical protein